MWISHKLVHPVSHRAAWLDVKRSLSPLCNRPPRMSDTKPQTPFHPSGGGLPPHPPRAQGAGCLLPICTLSSTQSLSEGLSPWAAHGKGSGASPLRRGRWQDDEVLGVSWLDISPLKPGLRKVASGSLSIGPYPSKSDFHSQTFQMTSLIADLSEFLDTNANLLRPCFPRAG